MVKNIVFDFGGVLLDWNPKYFYRTYFKDEKEMEYFLSYICTDEWNAEQDKGRSFEEGVRLLQKQYPQYAEPIRMFKDRWACMLKGAFPRSVDLLKRLKREGYGRCSLMVGMHSMRSKNPLGFSFIFLSR